MSMMRTFRTRLLLAAAVSAAVYAIPARAVADNTPVGTTFTYQGRLVEAGEPVSDPVDLVFRLFDQPNDGTLLGELVADNVTIDDDGRFTIDLDFGDQFTGDPRWLEIEVNGVNLSPRQPIMAAPHAMVATTAANVPTKAVLGSYAGITGVGTLDSLNVSGNVGIGTTNPQHGMHVVGPAGASAVYAENNWITIHGVHTGGGSFPGVQGESNSTATLASGVRGFITNESPGSSAAGVWGRNQGTTNNGYGVRGTHDGNGTGVYGESNSGFGGYFVGNGYFSGNLGLGTTSPQAKLHVVGNLRTESGITAGGAVAVNHDSPTEMLDVQGSILSRSRILAGYPNYFFWVDSNAQEVGIGTSNPQARLHVIGGGDTSPGSGGFLVLGNTNSNNVAFDSNEIMARNNGTLSPLHLNADGGDVIVNQNGSGQLVTRVLQITGGSDLAERFDVATIDDLTPEPGMVVCIDPANPGKLIPSVRAYDYTVAGVISGANGVNTGMLMGQKQSEADGEYPVALTGRVYVMADATGGAIKPGHLMTTSDVPGHAMKVSDHDRARGAIIGKAMTALDAGERGMVLVLVTLQ